METIGLSLRRFAPGARTRLVLIAGMGLAAGAVLAWQLAAKESRAPAFTFAYPVVEGGFESEPRFLPLEDLVQQADIVVLATISGKASYEKVAVGNPDLTAVDALYTLKVEEYLKGGGDLQLQLRKTVAYESPQFESTYLIDNLDPLAAGVQYVLALRKTGDGSFGPLAEPFRFVLDSGRARPESTIDEFQENDLSELGYPEMSETELRSVIASIAQPGPQ